MDGAFEPIKSPRLLQRHIFKDHSGIEFTYVITPKNLKGGMALTYLGKIEDR